MIEFNSLVDEAVQSTTRTGMLHLQKMPDLEFIEFIQYVKSAMYGRLGNLQVSLKVDGAGARFGRDVSGRPFFEGSRTGPIFEPKAFSAHAAAKGSAPEIVLRAKHYDDIFDVITQSEFIQTLPMDSKVVCELFYNPMGEMTQDGIKFVTVSYDRAQLGQVMSIVPFKVLVASTGDDHPDSQDIIDQLYQQSNDDIKFIDIKLATKGDIDISGMIDPILSLGTDAIATLQSRKRDDAQAKADIKAIIQTVKDTVAQFILTHPNILDKFKLGPAIEGLVLNINGRDIKVTTPEFKASKSKEASAHAAARAAPKPVMEFITSLNKVTKIPHPEDFIFQGSQKALEALQIINDAVADSRTISIKWDGSPAIVFGRRPVDGKFTMNYKSYITEPGGQVTTAQELEQFYQKRDGNPVVARKLGHMFNALASVVPATFTGYILADLLWDRPLSNGMQFRPNPSGVIYTLDPQSALGRQAAGKPLGLAIYMYATELNASDVASKSQNPFTDGRHIYDYAGLSPQSKYVCLFPSTAGIKFRLAEPVQLMKAAVNAVNRHGAAADALLEDISDSAAQVMQTWYNKMVTRQFDQNTPLTNYAGSKLDSAQMSTMSQHAAGLAAVDAIWRSIYALKVAMVRQLDQQIHGLGQSVGGQPVGEGFIVDSNSGLLKLVNRGVFSAANFAGRS